MALHDMRTRRGKEEGEEEGKERVGRGEKKVGESEAGERERERIK